MKANQLMIRPSLQLTQSTDESNQLMIRPTLQLTQSPDESKPIDDQTKFAVDSVNR